MNYLLSLSLLLVAWVLSVAWSGALHGQENDADIVLLRAKVHTMDSNQPVAEAVAIRGNRIVQVGKKEAIEKRIGAKTRKIDLDGRLVLPGFNDSHVHFLQGGQQLSSVQLRDARSPLEFTQRIVDFANKVEPGRWITGGDWDHENWFSGELPRREWIDTGTAGIGVFVSRLDGHMALVNSYALKLAGIDRNTADPPGGLIVRDEKTGEPTGILKDAAMGLVSKHIPPLTHPERLEAARAATNHAAALGVTSVQDMSGAGYEPVYRELLKKGELKTRIYSAAPLPQWKRSVDQGLRSAVGDAWIRQGALKGFADGSLGSTTALFFDPYLDDPRTSGLPSDEMIPESSMEDRVRQADLAQLHIMIHAIGDKANDSVLTIYERVVRTNGEKDRRFRIEHAQHLRPSDIPRFARQKVIASMQPYHCADDGRWALKRIGDERAKGTYAFRSLLDNGVILAFGSDWNVAPLNPIAGIAAAVHRQTLDGKHPNGWVPEQKITVLEAVYAYTMGSAYAEFTENEKGRIQPGFLADLVVLSKDIFTVGPDEMSTAEVQMTIVDGKIVFQSDRFQ